MSPHQSSSFLKADMKTWREAAKKELDGKDPFDTLSRQKESIRIRPYYDASDTKNIAAHILSPSTNPYLGPRGWYNMPTIKVLNDIDANKKALEHLNNGADGIVFKINDTISIDKLLANIELPYCSTFFLTEIEQSELLADFVNHVNAKGFDKTQIVGGLFSKSNQVAPIDQFKAWSKFHVLGNLVIPSSDPTSEIGNALIAGVNAITSYVEKGNQPGAVIQQMAFSFTVGTDFFTEIAKLKSFRRLWQQVSYAYGVRDQDESVFIHALSPCWNKEVYQPNANMLKSTTAAMSSILGGCDAISIEPEIENDSFKTRIARNVLTLLREESHLNQTADPTAGSYYLESLIDELSQVAWNKFQKEVSA